MTFLALLASRTSSMVLDLFANLALVGRKLLVLATKYISRRTVNGFSFSRVFSSFFVGLFLWKHFKSISWVSGSGCSNVFISISTVFSLASFQKFGFLLWASSYAQMEGFRPSQKYQIRISSFRVVAGLNSQKTACGCSRQTTQSKTCSS